MGGNGYTRKSFPHISTLYGCVETSRQDATAAAERGGNRRSADVRRSAFPDCYRRQLVQSRPVTNHRLTAHHCRLPQHHLQHCRPRHRHSI